MLFRSKQTAEEFNIKIKKAKNVKKRDLKYLSIGKALSIIRGSKSGLKKEKKDTIEEIRTKIKEIGKMNMIDYLKYLNEKEKDNESVENDGEYDIDSEESTIDDLIEKILKIKEISEDKNNDIYYKINFDLK